MLKTLAIVSELILYLTPVLILLRDFYYIYKTKRVMQSQYYMTLYALPLVTIVLSIKGVLIFKEPSTDLFLAAVDLGLALFLIIFVAFLVENVLKATNAHRARLNLLDFIIPAGTLTVLLINHSFTNWFDLFTYVLIGAEVLFVSMFFAKFDVRLKKYMLLTIFVSYFNVAVFALLGPKFVDSYLGMLYLSIAGLVIVIATAREAHIFVMNNLKALEVPEEVYHWHLKTMLRALTVAIVISVLSVVAVATSTVYVIAVNNKVKSDLLQTVYQESGAITDNSKHILINLANEVKLIPAKINSISDYKEVKKVISDVFSLYHDDFYYFDVVNDKGIVVAAYPWDSSIGDYVLSKGYAERILLTHTPTISPPLATQHGFHTFFICYPLFNNGEFVGFVEGAVNINIFRRAFLNIREESILSSVKSAIYENGIVLSSSGDITPLSGINNFYNYLLKNSDMFYKNTVFKFLNSRFGVLSYVPVSVLERYTNNVIHKVAVLLFLVIFALFYIMYLVISMLRNIDFHLGEAVEHAIKSEGEAKKTAVNVSKRLMELTEFFNTVSFAQSDKTFYNNLLDVAIKVIPSAQKGSIAIRNGNYLEFVAAYGYPIDVLKISHLPFEKQKSIMNGKTTVINHIREVDLQIFAKEELEGIRRVGGENIKSTLVVSIFSEGEYVGNIFIDNFDKENAFPDEDVKIAEAISNVASMFVQTKHYINKIKQTLKADAIIVSLMGKVKSDKKTEPTMSHFLSTLREEVSDDIIGVGAVVHSITGLLKLCATERVHSEMPIEKFKIDTTKSAFVNADDLDDVFWANNMKSIYFVPDKKLTGEGMCIGFSKPAREISNDLLELLNVLLPSAHDLISNTELSKELSRVYIELLISMIHSIELKDPYTRNHSERVTVFAYMLGKRYGLSMRELRTLYYAAMLHDIGKVGIPDEILHKHGSLSKEEFEVIKQHPQIGANMIMDVTFLKESAYIVLFHHEHYDGSGYSAHLKGDQIPLLSRIISIVDAFDAIITERPYKKAYSIDDAIEYLRKGRGTHFDPKLTDLFIEMLNSERSKFEEIIRKPDVMGIYEELFEI